MIILLFLSLIIPELTCAQEEFEEFISEIGTMQEFPGGPFFMGISDKDGSKTGEFPIRTEFTKPFFIDKYPVTNTEFEEFAKTTRYVRTEADINHFSYVFYTHAHVPYNHLHERTLSTEPWWVPVQFARWNRPYGPRSGIQGRGKYPVVHVSLADADAYCKWRGARLPTEFEWEKAVRGTNNTWLYPWGPGFRRNRMNTWQGVFPAEDTGMDGFKGLSPVDAFPAQSDFGLYDMLGNVWEWTTTSYYGSDAPANHEWVVLKGASFVDSVELGLVTAVTRCSTKQGRPYTFTAENVGFRCVKDIISPPVRATAPPMIYYEDTWHYKQERKRLEKRYAQLKRSKEEIEEMIKTKISRQEL